MNRPVFPRKVLGRIAVTALAVFLIPQLAGPCTAFAASTGGNVPDKKVYGPKIQYISEKNAPVFYGTSEITVPENTVIDLDHDARFRMFARDNEDGDMTQKIVVKSAPQEILSGKPLPAGEYTIAYSVTDQSGNTSTINVPVHVQQGGKEFRLSKLMYTLPSVQHLNELGYTRGNNHDRQIVGVFLDVGGEVEMRKISGKDGVGLTVALYNNDSRSEPASDYNNQVTNALKTAYSRDSDEGWVKIYNQQDLTRYADYKKTEDANNANNKSYISLTEEQFGEMFVAAPTVRTLYQDTEPGTVIYEVKWDADDEKVKPLHYYHQGDGLEDQEKFFDEWRADPGSYAIVDGWSIMALAPYEDVDMLLYNGGKQKHATLLKTLDEWFTYWDDVTEAYDEMIGISYTPDYYWNQNVKTKFFMRANNNGPGAAYYGGDCIGANNTVLWAMFDRSWGMLHETGHGYQGSVGNNTGLHKLTEVGVNFFSYYINTYRLDDIVKAGSKDSWLRKAANEQEFNLRRGLIFDDKADEENVGVSCMLYTFINVLDYFEGLDTPEGVHGYQEAYACINQYYRKVYFTENKKRLSTIDAWILALAENYHVDLTPYFETWQVNISQEVKDQVKMGNAQPLYYGQDMVGEKEAAALKEKLGNIGNYDLVSRDELRETGLDGTAKLHFVIDDFEQISGKNLTVTDGLTTKTLKVTGKDVSLALPVGVYKVALPKPDSPYTYENCYILVKNGEETEYDLSYTRLDTFDTGFGTVIKSMGYWGSEDKIPFTIYLAGHNVNIDYVGTMTKGGGHPADSVFSRISILGAGGQEKYSNSVNGNNALWVQQNTTVSEEVELGDKVEIYYAGKKSDLFSVNSMTGERTTYGDTDFQDDTITFVVTEYGLVPEKDAEDPAALYEKYVSDLRVYVDNFLEENDGKDLKNPFANPGNYTGVMGYVSKLASDDRAAYSDVMEAMGIDSAALSQSSNSKPPAAGERAGNSGQESSDNNGTGSGAESSGSNAAGTSAGTGSGSNTAGAGTGTGSSGSNPATGSNTGTASEASSTAGAGIVTAGGSGNPNGSGQKAGQNGVTSDGGDENGEAGNDGETVTGGNDANRAGAGPITMVEMELYDEGGSELGMKILIAVLVCAALPLLAAGIFAVSADKRHRRR